MARRADDARHAAARLCSRFDLMKEHAGIDIQALYPAGKPPSGGDWTWDAFLAAAEKCQKAGHAFGLPLGVTTDTNQWVGALFLAYGAELMDAKGNITVKTDAVRQVLEYGKRLAAFLPPDAPSWDDASNNKWLISGKGALIFNPPSAWAVAKRDAPQVAEKCWTHGFPKGPKGRFNPILPRFYGIWSFSKNKAAAKSLLYHLSSRENAETAGRGGPGLRHSALHEVQRLQDLGRRGPAEGHALALSQQGRPDHRRDLLAGAAADRGADLVAGDPAEDDRPLRQGRADGEDARLGRKRARRLPAHLRPAKAIRRGLPRRMSWQSRPPRQNLRSAGTAECPGRGGVAVPVAQWPVAPLAAAGGRFMTSASAARAKNSTVSTRNTSAKAITTPCRCTIAFSCLIAIACASLP